MERDMSKTVDLLKQRIDRYLQVQQNIKQSAEKIKEQEQSKAVRQGK